MLSVWLSVPTITLASTSNSCELTNPLGSSTTDLNSLLVLILKIVTEIGSIVVVFFIIYSGFLFVTAQGNEEKITKAKQALTWTLIGAAILLLGLRRLSP